jgi:hypothetical protein
VKGFFCFVSNFQPVPNAVYVRNFYRWVFLQNLPQAGNENIEATPHDDALVFPNGGKDGVPFQHLVGVLHKEMEEFGLPEGEGLAGATNDDKQVGWVKIRAAEMEQA